MFFTAPEVLGSHLSQNRISPHLVLKTAKLMPSTPQNFFKVVGVFSPQCWCHKEHHPPSRHPIWSALFKTVPVASLWLFLPQPVCPTSTPTHTSLSKKHGWKDLKTTLCRVHDTTMPFLLVPLDWAPGHILGISAAVTKFNVNTMPSYRVVQQSEMKPSRRKERKLSTWELLLQCKAWAGIKLK